MNTNVKLRADKAKRHAAFVSLIKEIIAAGAQHKFAREFEGFIWAVMRQDQWSAKLGFTTRTLRALAKIPPITSTITAPSGGPPIVLYRVGDAPHTSARTTATQMAGEFKKMFGTPVEKSTFGCLYGLSGVWPAGHQVDIFRHVIANWSAFMGVVRLVEPQSQYAKRFYEYPVIGLIRKFPEIAVVNFVIDSQKKGTSQHFLLGKLQSASDKIEEMIMAASADIQSLPDEIEPEGCW